MRVVHSCFSFETVLFQMAIEEEFHFLLLLILNTIRKWPYRYLRTHTYIDTYIHTLIIFIYGGMDSLGVFRRRD